MANMNINITGLDTIAQAINNLAQALGKGGVTASFSESTPAVNADGWELSEPRTGSFGATAVRYSWSCYRTARRDAIPTALHGTGRTGSTANDSHHTILYPGPDSHCTDWTHRPGQAGLCDADTGTVWRNVPHASAG